MGNELQIFQNEEFGSVRTIMIDNEPWFVGCDIANSLGYQNGSRDINRHVDEEDRTKQMVFDGNQNKETIVINESGVYALVFGSKLESAKKFKHWVTSEVLPSIRKTGGYHLPTTYKEALQQLIVQVEENERLQIENNEMKPKAEFFDAVAESKTAISMQDVAKVLDMGFGRNKLFEFLREEGVLDRWNKPYQYFVNNGWFRVIEQSYLRQGEQMVTTKTLVYQKGVDGIRKLILKKRGENNGQDNDILPVVES